VKRTAWAQQIHVVLNNLSVHKTKDVERSLQNHPQGAVSLHSDLLVLVEADRAVVRQDPRLGN
jgi:hypothetical protein